MKTNEINWRDHKPFYCMCLKCGHEVVSVGGSCASCGTDNGPEELQRYRDDRQRYLEALTMADDFHDYFHLAEAVRLEILKFDENHPEILTSILSRELDAERHDKALFQAASVMGQKGGSATSPTKQASSRDNGKAGGRPLHTWTDTIQVGIYENCDYTIRLYADRAVATIPYVKWVGNTGGYDERKIRITGRAHEQLIALHNHEVEDDADYTRDAITIVDEVNEFR